MPEPKATTSGVRESYAYDHEEDYGIADGRARFDRWLADVKAKTWDSCLDAIDQNELNTAQAREGNPHRALAGHGTPEPTGENEHG